MERILYIRSGFVAVIVLMMSVSIVALVKLVDIRSDLDNIYEHPFAVSNAALSIQYQITSMHRDMKDVALARTKQELEAAIEKVKKSERKTLTQFDLIAERFLGKKSQVNRTYKAFIDWEPIRDRVIELTRQGRTEEAIAITKGEGALHVAKLNTSVNALVEFANNKAREFKDRAASSEEQAVWLVAMLAALALCVSTIIAVFVVRLLRSSMKDAIRRQHLIDQNIMLASLDLDCRVLDATNALCRFLGTTKDDLIGTRSSFFDNSEEKGDDQQTIWLKLRTGKSWAGEIKHIGRDGKVQWVRSSLIPEYDDEMTISGYTNILEDSTSERLSGTDELTELYNRRRYDEIIGREIRQARREKTVLCLAIVDIDYFKQYNDFYGHPSGDTALAKVAGGLKQSLRRPSDFAFRIGGEEFALVFSGLDHDECRKYLDQVRSGIESLEIRHEKSSVSEYLTISVGAFVVGPHTEITDDELYELADKALYQAKTRRNCVIVRGIPGKVYSTQV